MRPHRLRAQPLMPITTTAKALTTRNLFMVCISTGFRYYRCLFTRQLYTTWRDVQIERTFFLIRISFHVVFISCYIFLLILRTRYEVHGCS